MQRRPCLESHQESLVRAVLRSLLFDRRAVDAVETVGLAVDAHAIHLILERRPLHRLCGVRVVPFSLELCAVDARGAHRFFWLLEARLTDAGSAS